jgi:hypothetical protein
LHLEITALAGEGGEKKHGGARAGAGRKRSAETPLAAWARENGYTSKRLAEELGVSQPSASGYLTGKQRPSPEVMLKLAELTAGQFGLEYWAKLPQKPSI